MSLPREKSPQLTKYGDTRPDFRVKVPKVRMPEPRQRSMSSDFQGGRSVAAMLLDEVVLFVSRVGLYNLIEIDGSAGKIDAGQRAVSTLLRLPYLPNRNNFFSLLHDQ